ncbi:MAG TPA: hypothetical protein VNU93_05065, partial [Verrucomicrobiae bacterium]|nr:hypothetical protein [Verrucomicrobiae bacterium]
SPRLKFGQVNTITFKMDKPAPNGPWLVWPGITGEVYLEAVGQIMLTEPRVSVKLSGSNAELEYDIGLNTKDTGELNGQISLFDGAGNLAATNTQVIKADKNNLRLNGKLSVPNPRLWSETDPYLYHLEVVVSGTRGARDSYVLPIGLREIQFADGGVILNKQRLEPKFLIRVAEPPGAERYSRMEADIKWAKAKGYNMLYLPDGPPHPYLLDLADKYGLLVMGQAQFTGSVSQNTRPHQAGDIIRSLGYHPSMLAQGLGAGLDSLNSTANEYIRKESVPGRTFYTTLGKPNKLIIAGGGELELNGPYLADYVWNRLSLDGQDFLSNHTARIGVLSGDRGEKEKSIPAVKAAAFPKAVPLAAAAVMLLLLMQSWGTDNLRFSQLNPEKPKRRFRNQVKQQARWYLLRHGALAAIFAGGAYSLGNNAVLEYLIDNLPGYKLQNLVRYLLHTTFALGMYLFGMGLLCSLIMAWLRSRTLPGKIGTVAMLLWLEKRKRWIVPAILAWNAVSFGLPLWLLWIALTLGFLMSYLTISNDIRRAGGKNYFMGYLMVWLILLLIILGSGWDRVTYIYHWLRV